MPPIDGTAIGVVLTALTGLVTALGAIQSRRDRDRKAEIAALRAEVAAQKRRELATVRWVYAAQLVLAARGVPETALPALPPELQELFDGPQQPADRDSRVPSGEPAARHRLYEPGPT